MFCCYGLGVGTSVPSRFGFQGPRKMTDMPTDNSSKSFTGRKTLLWFVGFFGVIITVNLIMVAFAINSFTGVDVDRSNRQGRDFGSELNAARTAQALGWKAESSILVQPSGRDLLIVSYLDANGNPVRGLKLQATFRRPTQKP